MCYVTPIYSIVSFSMNKVISLGFLALASMVGLAMCYGREGGFQKMGGGGGGGFQMRYPTMMRSYGYTGGVGYYGGGAGGGGLSIGGSSGGFSGIFGMLIFRKLHFFP